VDAMVEHKTFRENMCPAARHLKKRPSKIA
jgi:hypothetical protein